MTWDDMYKGAVKFDVEEGSVLGEDAVHFAVQQVNAALEEAIVAAQPFGGTGIPEAIRALKIEVKG